MDAEQVDYRTLTFDYAKPAAFDAPAPSRHPVVVVGAGPVGLAAAVDLARPGTRVVLLDDDDRLSTGSRAICFAKRTLEIFDRLGCGEPMAQKGVGWNTGRVFLRDQELYSFDLLGEAGHRRPAFVNLQQYYVEGYLARSRAACCRISRSAGSTTSSGSRRMPIGVTLTLQTPDGQYHAALRLPGRRRRRPQRDPQGARARKPRPDLPRPVPDRRRAHDRPVPRRTLVLVRPALPPGQSVLLHRQPDEDLAHRLPARLGRRPGGRAPAGAGHPPDPSPARHGRRIRTRMGQRLYLLLLAHGGVPRRPRAVRRRLRARRLPVRRARRQFRRAGRGQPGVEVAAGAGGRAPDRLLDSYASEREFAADENIAPRPAVPTSSRRKAR